jgi:hypothetical protein
MPATPLAGIKVLEFSHTVMGPTAGLVFAELGAEVIKVEPAPEGDHTRGLGGFGAGFFAAFNRNKRSLAVDLKRKEGQAVIHRLLPAADVILENFGPGTMERLRWGYEQLAVLNPRLVYLALNGYRAGPYEHRPALGAVRRLGGLRDFQNRSRWPAVDRRHQRPAMDAVCCGIRAAGIGRRPTPRDQCRAAGGAGMADPCISGGAGYAAAGRDCTALRAVQRVVGSGGPAGRSVHGPAPSGHRRAGRRIHFPLVAVTARSPAYRPCQSSSAPTDNVPAYGVSHRVWASTMSSCWAKPASPPLRSPVSPKPG